MTDMYTFLSSIIRSFTETTLGMVFLLDTLRMTARFNQFGRTRW